MIKKLRWKFIITAELSIFALLAIILVSINIVNFVSVANDADTVLNTIIENGGSFGPKIDFVPPEQGGENPPPEGWDERPFDPMGPFSPETRDSVRYFTVRISATGSASILEGSFNINAVTMEEAVNWGKSLSGQSKGWTRTFYRFRNYSLPNDASNKYVTIIDQSRELSPSYRVLYSSITGSLIGLGGSFLVLLYASRRFVKPLEESEKKQKRFISDASHELKTPLTIISANAELLELEQGGNEQTESIKHQVGKLTGMIRELNDLARIEELDTVEEKINIADIAADVFSSFKPAFESRELKFQEDIPDSVIIKKNENAVRKLLSIVLENASKYALTHVDFSLKQEQSRTIIICKNDANLAYDGPMDRVFERFYRSDETRNKVEGSGIGLSIAKGIVDQMKGRIYAKSKGGEFILKIEL